MKELPHPFTRTARCQDARLLHITSEILLLVSIAPHQSHGRPFSPSTAASSPLVLRDDVAGVLLLGSVIVGGDVIAGVGEARQTTQQDAVAAEQEGEPRQQRQPPRQRHHCAGRLQ